MRSSSCLPKWQKKKLVLSSGTYRKTEDLLAERRHVYKKFIFADCQGIVDNLDSSVMYSMLQMLESSMMSGVVIEFAITDRGKYLEAEPAPVPLLIRRVERVHIPTGVDDNRSSTCARPPCRSRAGLIDIVWLDPRKYAVSPRKRTRRSPLIGRINHYFKGDGLTKSSCCWFPTRIGTSSRSLACRCLREINRLTPSRGGVQDTRPASRDHLWKPYVPGSGGRPEHLPMETISDNPQHPPVISPSCCSATGRKALLPVRRS